MISATFRLRPAQSLFLSVSLLLAGAAAWVLYCFDPVHFHFYPVCVFHQTTGLLCPGCGTLRALHQLLHGRIATALRCNALFVLTLPLVCGFLVRVVFAQAVGRPAPSIRPMWLWVGLGAMVAFGILRNLLFPAFVWLAPVSG